MAVVCHKSFQSSVESLKRFDEVSAC